MVAEPDADMRPWPLTCGHTCNSIARHGSPTVAARAPAGHLACRLRDGCSAC